MGKQKREIKGILNLLKRIEEHILKFQDAKNIGDIQLAEYYINEIELKFMRNVEKAKDGLRIGIEIEQQILSTYQHRNAVKKSLPLN